VKILHVVPTYLPAWRYGGPIVAVHGLCRALVERGHEVTVFTTNVDGPDTLDVAPDSTLDGVRIRYFASPFRRLYWSPAMSRALGDVAAFDVVHVHAVFLWPGVAAARAARRNRVPYVISPRGMLVPELIAAKSSLAKNAWLRFAERPGFAGAAAIHFTSELERRDAARVGLPIPSSIVVPNGVDVPPIPAVERDPATLLFLGRISWKKNLDAVLQALPQLPEARLIVAGPDDEGLTPRLRELADRLGVGGRVSFPGPVYGNAKLELLARATLFVLLSHSENFGNAVLEALSMRTPVVLSPNVGLAEEVVRAGAGVLGAEAIAPLLADPDRRVEMGRRGRELVEQRFAWDAVAAAMEEAYRGLRRT
jgi:glycosyltransferase involved in cell wall biosynthesis